MAETYTHLEEAEVLAESTVDKVVAEPDEVATGLSPKTPVGTRDEFLIKDAVLLVGVTERVFHRWVKLRLIEVKGAFHKTVPGRSVLRARRILEMVREHEAGSNGKSPTEIELRLMAVSAS